jgi:hypothetical protein
MVGRLRLIPATVSAHYSFALDDLGTEWALLANPLADPLLVDDRFGRLLQEANDDPDHWR